MKEIKEDGLFGCLSEIKVWRKYPSQTSGENVMPEWGRNKKVQYCPDDLREVVPKDFA